MAEIDNNYVYGRGELHFDRMAPGTKTGTGERYLGNTPEFSLSTTSEALDHYDADHGINVKDDSIDTSNDLTASVITDNINGANLALFFTGDQLKNAVAAATAITDPDITVSKDRTYQLGTTDAQPAGARNINNVVAKKVTPGALPTDPPVLTPITLTGNIEVDLDLGRAYILADAPGIAEGDVVRFTYDQDTYTNEIVIGKADSIFGAMRFISMNPKGKKRDVFLPYVKLTPNGDYNLKGDDWQQFGFSLEVLKKNSATERIYITTRD